ncbi:MAG TPA: NADH-quinone oxidoreductase subunit M [Herpetosiphonaceae bacterium]|nr:NADH-quinone oxidoreductase subunit M [Herpetosiphonaceae bacterium]
MTNFPLLSLVLWMPAVGALLLLAPMSDALAKRFAFGWSALVFLASLPLIPGLGFFDPTVATLQLQERLRWIPAFGIDYFLGIDGISIWLVMLTTFLTPITILSTWDSIGTRVKAFQAFMLLLETGMLGVFLAQDLILFYIFWEFTLVPMYFLIGIWGGTRRIYATVKFFLYTFAGSIFMLLAIIALYVLYGRNSFSVPDMVRDVQSGAFALDPSLSRAMFLAFFAAFAVKVPLWPFHSWLPDAHTEAPTPGSVILAGVLLKLGGYGFLRFNLPLFPDASRFFAPAIGVLAVIGIIYGAVVAFAQQDIKKLVAYSSVSHLGFVMLGIFSLRPEGIDGAILQMVNHGISTGALFLIVGFIYERRHTRDIDAFGGLWKVMPIYSFLSLVIVLSSLGLPGLNGFVGEAAILFGTARSTYLGAWFAAFALIGVILAAVYLLWMFRKVMMAEVNDATAKMRDVTRLELAMLVPLVVLIVLIGLYPTPFFAGMDSSVTALAQVFEGPALGAR